MFVDTHCHIGMMVLDQADQILTEKHFALIDEIIAATQQEHVDIMINIGASVIETNNSLALAKRYQQIFATVGIHPCDCSNTWLQDLKNMEIFLKEKEKCKIVGIGESGLDFYHKPFNKSRQEDAFKVHIELAMAYNLPVVVHAREASDEVLKLLEPYVKQGLRGVLHCFSHSLYVAQQVLAWGFYIGIDGHITYPKNNELREIIKQVPHDRLLLETDAPFLPPQQFRGKRNSPVYIPLIAKYIADLCEIAVEKLERQTTANAFSLFAFDHYQANDV